MSKERGSGLDKHLFARLVAQTCECGGFSTLVGDLLHDHTPDKKSDLATSTYAPYRQGLVQKLVAGPKLKTSAGARFSALVQPCEEWDEALLLAVRTKTGVLINPGPSYTIDPLDKGIILCSKYQAGAAVKDIEKGVPIPTSAKDSYAIPPSGGSVESFHRAASPALLRDVCISSADAISPNGGHIVIGGNLEVCNVLPELVKHLRASYFPLRKILLMETSELSSNIWDEVAKYPDVYFLKGDMTMSDDLSKAGVTNAHCIILLSPWIEEEKKGKKKKGEVLRPYVSVMKVRKILKEDMKTNVRTLLCIGKGHKGTAKDLPIAQKEYQTLNHPYHSSSTIISYDLLEHWLAKAFSSKKGILGETIERLIMTPVQSVPVSLLQSVIHEQAAKSLTFGQVIDFAGIKGFLPLGVYHFTGSEDGSYVCTHPERSRVLAVEDSVILLWPLGESPATLPFLPVEPLLEARERAETTFEEYIFKPKTQDVGTSSSSSSSAATSPPIPSPSSTSTMRPAAPPALAPPPSLSLPTSTIRPAAPPALTPPSLLSPLPTLAPPLTQAPPPSVSQPPSSAPPPLLSPPSARPPPTPVAIKLPDADCFGSGAPPPPPPRDEEPSADPPPPMLPSREPIPSPRTQPAPPPRNSPRPDTAPTDGISLAGVSPRSPPSTAPRVAVPPRPVLTSASSSSSPRSPSVSPRADDAPLPAPPVEQSSLSSSSSATTASPRTPPAVSPRNPPPAPPRDPPSSPSPAAAKPPSSSPPEVPAAASQAPPSGSAPPPQAQASRPPPTFHPLTPPSSQNRTLQRQPPPPSLSLPPALKLPPTLAPPPSLTPPAAAAAPPHGEAPRKTSFATARRPLSAKPRALTALHRTLSSSTLNRLHQQEEQDDQTRASSQSTNASVAAAADPAPPAPLPRSPSSPAPPSPSLASSSSSSSSSPPVFTPVSNSTPVAPPRFNPAPSTPAATKPATSSASPTLRAPPALVPPPRLAAPPALVPPPTLSPPPGA